MDLLCARAQSVADEIETKCAGLSEQEGWPLNAFTAAVGLLLLRPRNPYGKTPPRAQIPDELLHLTD